jgi:hypothetical protein
MAVPPLLCRLRMTAVKLALWMAGLSMVATVPVLVLALVLVPVLVLALVTATAQEVVSLLRLESHQ